MTLHPDWRTRNYPGGPFSIPPPAKRKVFVSYHHERDQFWFNHFTIQFSEGYEVFEDRSLDEEVNSDDLEYVNRLIREDYIRGSSVTIVLCGNETWKRRFVDWEIASTLHYEHALLGILIPGTTVGPERKYLIPDRLYDNVQSGYAFFTVQWPSGPDQLKAIIEAALREGVLKSLIRNERVKMRRNLS